MARYLWLAVFYRQETLTPYPGNLCTSSARREVLVRHAHRTLISRTGSMADAADRAGLARGFKGKVTRREGRFLSDDEAYS